MTDDRTASTFCTNLRRMRRHAKLTQKELADLAGMSVRALRDLERGRVSRPRRQTLHLLADAFRLRGDRRSEFLTSAAPRVDETTGENDDPPALRITVHDDNGQDIADVLIFKRHTPVADLDDHGEDIVITVTRGLGSSANWSVRSVACLPAEELREG